MTTLLQSRCPRCGRPHDETAHSCDLCGMLLKRPTVERITPRVEEPGSTMRTTTSSATVPTITRDETAPAWEPWLYLGIGLATAPVFALTPILKFMGWFPASLVHEMGHSAVASSCGMPSIPAISLAGHAAAVHQDQSKFLVALIACGLAGAAWKFLAGHWRFVQPAVVFVIASEL